MTRSISAAAKAPLGKRILKNWQLYLFVLPAVAYFIIFKYVPLYGIQTVSYTHLDVYKRQECTHEI